MRIGITFILLMFMLPTFSQSGQYILFEERPPFDTVNLAPFKLLYNHVKLSTSKGNPGLEIFNLYFSKFNFQSYGLDGNAFFEAVTDYRKLQNDVLITVTPLTDSLKFNLVKISENDVQHLRVLKSEDILQLGIKELYRTFTADGIQHDKNRGFIKTFRYKLLIKKGNAYYRLDVPVLTEYYLIDKANYLFPVQYHYGEINVMAKGQTRYFDGQDIFDILQEYRSYSPRAQLLLRTYLSKVKTENGLNIYTYWTYPGNDILGIGKFQFIEGVGIINGSFGSYFDKHFIISLENNIYGTLDDFNGPMRLTTQSINGLSLKAYEDKINKARPPGMIMGDLNPYQTKKPPAPCR
jgi:hypothetical protein